MKSKNDILDSFIEVVIYSLIQWILISGLMTNRASWLGFMFFFLSIFLHTSIFSNLKMRFTNKKILIYTFISLNMVFSVLFLLLLGYFEIKLIPFSL